MNPEGFKKSIEDIGATLDPDDDWMPALFLEKQNEMMVIGLAGDCMCNDETKDVTAKLMTKLISDIKPESVCFISTAWTVAVDKDRHNGPLPRPSQHPDRIEIVICICVDKTSVSGIMGEIQRTLNHPVIKKWRDFDTVPTTWAGGRFLDAMRKGLENG